MKKSLFSYKNICLLLGPVLFFGLRTLLTGIFTLEAATAIALVFWMIFWWTTAPVSLAVSAFLPIIVNTFFPFISMGKILPNYFSGTVVLLMGACMLVMPWSTTGLDKRLAIGALRIVGTNVKTQIMIWFLVSMLFSSVLPNTVVVTLLTPVGVAMLRYLGHDNFVKSPIAAPILLAIANGTTLGGCLTPLGGSMNLVAIDVIEQFTGQEFMYIDWLTHVTPLVLTMGVFMIIVLFLTPVKLKTIEGSTEFFAEQYKELGVMRKEEKTVALLFIVGAILCFARPLYETIFPSLEPSYVLFTLGILTVIIPGDNGKPLQTWAFIEKNMMWNMIFLVAGGGLMGVLFTETGATDTITQLVSNINLTGGFMTVFIFVAFTYFFGECATHNTGAALGLPLVLSITTMLGLNPTGYVFVACVAYCGAYVIPAGIRAVTLGYGVTVKDCVLKGTPLMLVQLFILPILGYLFITYWPFFSYYPGLS